MWGNNNYVLRFEDAAFYHHEQVILSAGTCPGFLPMTFLREYPNLTVRYEADGFLPLSSYRVERTRDVLYLIEKVVLILHACPEYLLAPERVTLRASTVFYSRERDDLQIAFIPRADEDAPAGAGARFPSEPDSAAGARSHSGPHGAADARSRRLPASGPPEMALLSPVHRELIQFLAQLKKDLRDPHKDFVLRLARDLCYNCRDTSDMLRRIGLLRRELDSLPKGESA